jgi:4-amino-4-deoxy-L-arabinose transferase-like glycosyltransferase
MRRQKQLVNPNAAQGSRIFLPWFIVAVIIIVTAGLRIRLLNVPFERDEGEYAYAGRLMLQGIPPYSLVYNMKFPGIYAAYAFIMSVFGQTRAGVHFGLLIVNIITILLMFLLARFLIDSFTGVFAAAAFAVLSLAESVDGIFANAEHFVILFAVAGILLLLLSIDLKSLLLLPIASLLLGIGFLMKQHGIVFIVFAGLYLIFAQLRCKPFVLKHFLVRIALFTIGVLLPFAVT